ncbi:MAG TPA: cupin domain-containing protein [Terracidiphilus sp.]|nr:cupin domain-containing protein [Terracidiphilus sp.]
MPIPRRAFLQSAVSVFPAAAFSSLIAQSTTPTAPILHPVGAGQDRLGSPHTLGFSSLAFKVLTADAGGNLFLIEHSHLTPGGPPLHMHLNQDEWFYVMEGEVVFQVGDQRAHLKPGESVLAPRRVPHTFSSVAPQSHLLIAFTPAGKMEQFFLDAEAHPSLAFTAEFINRYEMQWIGPSPFWKS